MPSLARTVVPGAVLVSVGEGFIVGSGCTSSSTKTVAPRGAGASASRSTFSALGATVAAATVASAAALARPRAQQRAARALRLAEPATAAGKEAIADKEAAAPAAPAASLQKDLPVAVPFLGPPAYRAFVDGSVPGDAGFDPAGFSKDLKTFTSMREAEIKHARLAMLAAVGWPLAELDEPGIAASIGFRDDLAPGGLAPSVLNGGLFDGDFPVSLFYGIFVLVAAIVDLSKFPDSPVGDYGFDPLKLKSFVPPAIGGSISKGRAWTAEAEVKNGRLAMIAITAYAFQEFASKVPVTQETPFLFKPPF